MTNVNQGDINPEDDEIIDDIVDEEDSEKPQLTEKERAFLARAKKAEAKVKELKATPKPEVKTEKPEAKEIDYDKLVDEKLNKRLAERDIENLDYSDNVKGIVKDLVSRGKSVSEALKDPYTIFHMEKEEREERNESAGAFRTPRAFSRSRENREDPVSELNRKHSVDIPRGESVVIPESHFEELDESLKKLGADTSKYSKINTKKRVNS